MRISMRSQLSLLESKHCYLRAKVSGLQAVQDKALATEVADPRSVYGPWAPLGVTPSTPKNKP